MSAKITTITEESIENAVQLLQQGELVCFPTETVYALAADALNPKAVEKVYAAKGRNLNNPLSLLIGSNSQAQEIGVIHTSAQRLMAKYFPGPLTLVVPVKQAGPLPPSLYQPRNTIGIRMPDHTVALLMLEKMDRPLIGTSVNRSGEPSATNAQEALCLAEHVAIILDGGTSVIGKASTVVDVTGDKVAILREGAIPAEAIFSCITP